MVINHLPADLTSGGQQVDYWQSGDGLRIIGYSRAEPAPGTEPPEGNRVLKVRLLDPESSTARHAFDLHEPLDHGGTADPDLTLSVRTTDRDGDEATTCFTIAVIDDTPAAGSQSAVSLVEGGGLIGHNGAGWTRGTANLLDNEEEYYDRQAELVELGSSLTASRLECAARDRSLRRAMGVADHSLYGFPLSPEKL